MATKNSKRPEGAVYAIQPDDQVVVYSSDSAPGGMACFSSETELAALSASWPPKTFIDVWNRLPDVTAVRKFTDRKTAVRRIWQAISQKESVGTKQSGVAQPADLCESVEKVKPPEAERASTKREQIITLLKRPEGATLKTIMAATGWQPHSVRGFVSGQLTKKMRLKVKSFTRDGERVYRIRT